MSFNLYDSLVGSGGGNVPTGSNGQARAQVDFINRFTSGQSPAGELVRSSANQINRNTAAWAQSATGATPSGAFLALVVMFGVAAFIFWHVSK